MIFGYVVPAEALEIISDPKMRNDAENYLAANPQQTLRVASLKELKEQDKGGNYKVVYPTSFLVYQRD